MRNNNQTPKKTKSKIMADTTSTYTIDASQVNKELEKIEKRINRINELFDELSATLEEKPKRPRKPKAKSDGN